MSALCNGSDSNLVVVRTLNQESVRRTRLTQWRHSCFLLSSGPYSTFSLYTSSLGLKEPSGSCSCGCCSVAKSCPTPWTAAHEASLFSTISQSLPKFMSIESVMLSNHLILCHPLLLLPSIFPSIRWPKYWSFSQLHWAGSLHQVAKVLVSALASILPMTIQGWFPLGLTGLISLLSKGLSRVFSSTTVQKHQFFGTQLSF